MTEPSPQDYFGLVLQTVVGQAFGAAGYVLDDNPTQQAGGRFRYSRRLEDGLNAFIEFQMLHYIEGRLALFKVILTRTDQPTPAQPSQHPRYAQRDLSALVVQDFGVAILPSADHWWQYHNTTELGKALAEAGHLIVGYGMPWLAGELMPPEG
jgi:hypothetical protein